MKRLMPFALAVLGGCAGGGDPVPGPAHPADAAAAETPWSPPPDRLAGPVEPLEGPKAPEGVTWSCPMHPEVTSDKAGTCPKCGMDLAPGKVGEHDHK